MTESMIEFRLKGAMNRSPKNAGTFAPGEICLMRLAAIVCLFPVHRQIRTIENGWTVEVYEEDWPKVEKAFRSQYLGNHIRPLRQLSAFECGEEPK